MWAAGAVGGLLQNVLAGVRAADINANQPKLVVRKEVRSVDA
jgi:hypothetical protein